MPGPAAVLQILITANSAQATAALAKTQAALTTTASTAEKSTTRMSRATGRMNTALNAVGKYTPLALGAAGVASVKMAVDFEDAMQRIHSTAGASQAEVDKLKGAVLDFAKTSSHHGPIDLANALYRVESAGYRGAKAMQVLEGAERLAHVGGSELEDTTTALVGAMRSGVKGAGNVTRAIGTLNAIVGAGNMRMGELVSAMGTGFLSNAKQMGLSLKQAGAALAVLTVQGQPATAAATRLSMAFRMMMAPTDKAAKALAIVHLNAQKLGSMMQAGRFPAAIALLAQRLDALGKSPQALQQKAQIIRDVFGARSSSGINAILQGLQQYDRSLKQVSGESSRFHEKEIAQNKTLQAHWNQLKARAGAYAVQIGTVLIPALIKVMDVLNWVVKANLKLSGAGWKLAKTIAAAFVWLFGRLKSIGAAIGGRMASLAGVIGRVGKTFNHVKNAGVSAFNAIRGPVVSAGKAIIAVLAKIVRVVASVINAFKELKGGGGNLLDKGTDVLKNLLPGGFAIGGLQKGGRLVPGSGSGDKVLAMLEPGEVVWNREAVRKIGGAKRADAANSLFPRFAGGGIAQGVRTAGRLGISLSAQAGLELLKVLRKRSRGALGGGSAAWQAVDALANKWGNTTHLGMYDRLGQPGSWHGVAGPGGRSRATDYSGGNMLAFAKKMAKRYGSHLLELIHTPLGYSIKDGHRTGLIDAANHYNHVHVAMQKGGVVPTGNWNKNQLTTLAAFVGMKNPALMAAIAMAESGGNPSIRGAAGEYGLWQIMPSWGGGSSLLDPIKNARKARYVLGKQGLTAWTTYKTGAYKRFLGGHVLAGLMAALRGGKAGNKNGKGAKGGRGTPLEQIQMAIDLAALTEGTADDIAAAQQLVAYWQSTLDALKKQRHPKAKYADISNAATSLASAQESLASLTEAGTSNEIEAYNARIEALNEVIQQGNLLALQGYQVGSAQNPLLGISTPTYPTQTPLQQQITSLPAAAAPVEPASDYEAPGLFARHAKKHNRPHIHNHFYIDGKEIKGVTKVEMRNAAKKGRRKLPSARR